MALGSTLSQMLVIKISETSGQLNGSLDIQGTMMMIISLALGAFFGELLNLDRWFERFGGWLCDKAEIKKMDNLSILLLHHH